MVRELSKSRDLCQMCLLERGENCLYKETQGGGWGGLGTEGRAVTSVLNHDTTLFIGLSVAISATKVM